MAISSYGRALGQVALEKTTGAVTSFAQGVKGAFFSQMPAYAAATGFINNISGRASKFDSSKTNSEEIVQEQKKSNVISLDAFRELKLINENTAKQVKLSSMIVDADNRRRMFEEESERERNLYNEKILKALLGLKFNGGKDGKEGSKFPWFLLGSLGAWLIDLDDIIRAIKLPQTLAFLGKNLNKIIKFLGSIVDAFTLGKLGNIFENLKTKFATAFDTGIKSITSAFDNFKTKFLKSLDDVFKNIRLGFKVGELGPEFANLRNLVLSKTGFLGQIGAFFGEMNTRLQPVFKYLQDVGTRLQATFEPIRNFFANLSTKFVKGFQKITDLVQPIFAEGGTLSKLFAPLKSVFKFLGGPITMFFFGLYDFVSGFVNEFKQSESILNSLTNATVELFKGFVTYPLDLLKDITSWIAEKLGFDNFAKTLDSFSFTDMFNDAIYGIIEWAGSVLLKFFDIKPGDVGYETLSGLVDMAKRRAKGSASKSAPPSVDVQQLESTGQAKEIPLSVRNNNPGNLRFSTNLTGQGSVLEGATKGEGGFAKFETPEAGLEAMRRQVALDTQKRGATLRQFIKKYAPPSENDTNKYIDFVSKQTGLNPDDKVPASMIPAVMRSMTQMEGGTAAVGYFYGSKSLGATASTSTTALSSTEKTAPVFDSTLPVVNVPKSSGTMIAQNAPIPVHDTQLTKETEKTTKELQNLKKTTVKQYETQVKNERLRETKRILTPQEKAQEALNKAQENTLNSIDRALTKVFGAILTDTLTPKSYGVGVTAQQASQVGYIGNVLGKATGFDKSVSNALTKAFGKEYGQMLAPAVAGLGKAYANKFALDIGTSLFEGTMGKEGAATITGQIIGNFAKGNKQMAMEQMLYAFTGIPSGPETIAQHFGFKSAADGIKAIAETGSAYLTNQIQDITGFAGKRQEYAKMPDMSKVGYGGMARQSATPILGKEWQASVTRGSLDEGDAGEAEARAYAERLRNKITTEDVVKANDSAIETPAKIDTLEETTNAWGEQHEEVMYETNKADIQTQQAVGAETIGAINNLGTVLASRPSGGGTTISMGGDFMSSFGNFAANMAVAYVGSKLTQGIKNPYLKAAANFGINYAAQNYLLPSLGKSIGINLGAKTAAGTAAGGNIPGMPGGGGGMNAMMYTLMNPISSISTAFAYNTAIGSQQTAMLAAQDAGVMGSYGNIANMGNAFSMANISASLQSPTTLFSNSTTMGQIGQGVGYAYAAYQLTKGDVAGATKTAISTYLMATGNPVLMAIGFALNFLKVGGPKRPTMERAIVVKGNNDISKKFTSKQENIEGDNAKKVADMLDAFLNVAFTTTKNIHAKTKIEPPFVAIGVQFRNERGLYLGLYVEGQRIYPPAYSGGGKEFTYPDPTSDEFNPGQIAGRMARDIRDYYMQGKSEDQMTAITEATKEITRRTFDELAGGKFAGLSTLNTDIPVSAMDSEYNALIRQMETNPEIAASVDSDTGVTTSRMLYNPLTGKYETAAENALAFDAQGRPIIDVGTRGFTMEDLVTHRNTSGGGSMSSSVNVINQDSSSNDNSSTTIIDGGGSNMNLRSESSLITTD